MWVRKFLGAMAGASLVCAFVISGCSSSNSNPSNGDGGAGGGGGAAGGGTFDAHVPPPDTGGAGGGGGAAGGGSAQCDGSSGFVGAPCQSDTDCGCVAPGLTGHCSNNFFTLGPLNPTPICIATGCQPDATQGYAFCDGPAGIGSLTNSGPGICLAFGTTPFCMPACSFDNTGAAPQGCTGKDACNIAVSGDLLDDAGLPTTPFGLGYCFGGCEQDSDCTALNPGTACQVEDGVCVKTKKTYSKTIGEACAKADDGVNCRCIYGNTTQVGYCSQFCEQATGTACPSGFVCDSFLQSTFTFTNDAGTGPGFTKEPQGLGGYCFQACSTPDASNGAEGGSVDAGVCTNATCVSNQTAGDDCQPQ